MKASNTYTMKHASGEVRLTAFAGPNGFLSLTFGEFHRGEFTIQLTPDEAQALAMLLEAGGPFARAEWKAPQPAPIGLGESAVTA